MTEKAIRLSIEILILSMLLIISIFLLGWKMFLGMFFLLWAHEFSKLMKPSKDI